MILIIISGILMSFLLVISMFGTVRKFRSELNLDIFILGGHNLGKEIMAHEGEFCWIEITY